MKRKYTIMITSFILFGLLCPAIGQTQSNAAQFANTIAPFIDDQTFAVARLDISQLDIDAIVKQALEFLPDQSDETSAIRKEITLAIYAAQEIARLWQQTFAKAGGRDIYGVYSMYDVPYFFVVVPLEPGADVPTLKSWLATVAQGFDIGVFDSTQIGNVLVAGRKETVERVKTMQTTARPELMAAFVAANDATVHLLVLPTLDQRRVIEEMMPSLALPNGDIPSTTLTQGIRWMAVGLNLPPQMSLNARAKSQDAQAAQNLKNLVDQFYAYIGSVHEVQQLFPNIKELLDRVQPSVKADQVVLSLDTQEMDSLFHEIRQSIVAIVQEETCQIQCRRQLMRMGNGFAMYQNDYDGKNPPTLKPLVEEEGLPPECLICPAIRAKGGKETYIYRGIDLNPNIDSGLILVHDKKGNHKGYRNVLFNGGHVERLAEEKFQEEIKRDNELRKKNNLPEKPAE